MSDTRSQRGGIELQVHPVQREVGLQLQIEEEEDLPSSEAGQEVEPPPAHQRLLKVLDQSQGVPQGKIRQVQEILKKKRIRKRPKVKAAQVLHLATIQEKEKPNIPRKTLLPTLISKLGLITSNIK